MISPDYIYIGYPKAASSYIRQYLTKHPDIYWDRNARKYLYDTEVSGNDEGKEKRTKGKKIYVSMNEKLAMSIYSEDFKLWVKNKYCEDKWSDIKSVSSFEPKIIAKKIKCKFPECKILIVIREQSDWLDSLYRMYISSMPNNKRTFIDFCSMPIGRILLNSGFYDYLISEYIKVFGKENVLIMEYEKLKSFPEGFLRQLCCYLNIEYIPADKSIVNKGISPSKAHIYRHIPFAKNLPSSIKKICNKIMDYMPIHKGKFLSPDEIRLIKSIYSISNIRTKNFISEMRIQETKE